MISRRSLLAGASAMAALPLVPRRTLATGIASETLEAALARVQIAPEGYPQTEIWGYGGTVPGTEIRVVRHARVGGLVQLLVRGCNLSLRHSEAAALMLQTA